MLGAGALMLVTSVCGAFTFLLAPLVRAQTTAGDSTALASVVTVLLVFGALLAAAGYGLVRQTFSAPFRLPHPLILLLAFFIVLLFGQTMLGFGIGTRYLFPIWHVLASLLFPLAVLSAAARRLEPVSARSVWAQFTWGGLVTLLLALLLEVILGGIVIVAGMAFLFIALGRDWFDRLTTAMQATPPDTTAFLQAVTQEPLAILVIAAVAILLFVILIPLLEELLKAAGAAILIGLNVRAGDPPAPSSALLWGLAAGAGYAFSENMFNAQGGLGAGNLLGWWAGAMLLRGGTSLMHVVATGTVAVGWYEVWVNKRAGRFLLLLLLATVAHGLWNTCALILGSVTALTSQLPLPIVGAAVGCMLLLLGLLFLGALVWLRVLTLWGRRLPVGSWASRFLSAPPA